jgi:hypothetical protein
LGAIYRQSCIYDQAVKSLSLLVAVTFFARYP